MLNARTALAILVLAAAGCGSDEPAPAPAAPAAKDAQPAREQQGRIDKVQAADMVGYDGAAVKRQLEKAVDANEVHNQQSEAARQAAAGGGQ